MRLCAKLNLISKKLNGTVRAKTQRPQRRPPSFRERLASVQDESLFVLVADAISVLLRSSMILTDERRSVSFFARLLLVTKVYWVLLRISGSTISA